MTATLPPPRSAGIDYANARPSPTKLAALGFVFVVRYLSPNTPANPGKRITRAEIRALRAAMLAICFVWETTTTEWTGDGAADYRRARAYATSIGIPPWVSIYLAVDANIAPTDVAQVRRYIGAAVDAAGTPALVGVYGGLAAVQAIRTTLPKVLRWQTYAWSHGVWDTALNVAQTHNGVTVAGVTVDLDTAYTTNYGQWSPPMSDATPVTTDDIIGLAWQQDLAWGVYSMAEMSPVYLGGTRAGQEVKLVTTLNAILTAINTLNGVTPIVTPNALSTGTNTTHTLTGGPVMRG